MKYFELVHVKPDKSERIIKMTEDAKVIHTISERFQWTGTWLSPTRKLLRHNRGELHIREKIKQPRVVDCSPISVGGKPWYECILKYHDELQSICFNHTLLIGYTKDKRIAWTATSLTDLADKYVGKELACQISRYYDQYLDEHSVKGAM